MIRLYFVRILLAFIPFCMFICMSSSAVICLIVTPNFAEVASALCFGGPYCIHLFNELLFYHLFVCLSTVICGNVLFVIETMAIEKER